MLIPSTIPSFFASGVPEYPALVAVTGWLSGGEAAAEYLPGRGAPRRACSAAWRRERRLLNALRPQRRLRRIELRAQRLVRDRYCRRVDHGRYAREIRIVD